MKRAFSHVMYYFETGGIFEKALVAFLIVFFMEMKEGSKINLLKLVYTHSIQIDHSSFHTFLKRYTSASNDSSYYLNEQG